MGKDGQTDGRLTALEKAQAQESGRVGVGGAGRPRRRSRSRHDVYGDHGPRRRL